MKNTYETGVTDVIIAQEENYELIISNFNSYAKTKQEKELEKIIANINKDDLINLEKLKNLKLIKNCFEKHTDDFYILLLLMNFSEKCLNYILEEVSEGLEELTVEIFTKYDFCPGTIQDFNSILCDDSSFLSQKRKIIKEAINLELIERQKLYLSTKNTLENKILLANVSELISHMAVY